MCRTALVSEIYIFNHSISYNRLFVLILILKPPNTVKPVQFAYARTVLIRPLEVSLQLSIIMEPVSCHKIPGAKRIPVIILRITLIVTLSSSRWQKYVNQILEFDVIWILFYQFPPVISPGIPSELCIHLHTHSHRKRLRKLCTEIATLIMRPYACVYKMTIIAVMIFQPIVLHIFPIRDFTLNLHPTVGKWYVLKIHETDTHFRNRTGIIRLDEIAYPKTAVKQRRCPLLHTCHQKHATIFHFGIQLLQPYGSRFSSNWLHFARLHIIMHIVNLARSTCNEISSKGIAEPPRQIQIFPGFFPKIHSLGLRDHTTIIRHYIIGSQTGIALTNRTKQLSLIMQRRFSGNDTNEQRRHNY